WLPQHCFTREVHGNDKDAHSATILSTYSPTQKITTAACVITKPGQGYDYKKIANDNVSADPAS
ncbi:hypothetical protein F444_04787, partial [Phytophthora nicotianae P1976]